MFKLKPLIKEYIQREDTEPFDDNDIIYIEKYLKGAMQFDNLICRGVYDLVSQGYEIRQTRKNRFLKDTSEVVNAIVSGYISYLGMSIPDRKSALFASNAYSIAKGYGNYVAVIFPKKGSKIYYNEEYSDSYNVTDMGFIPYLREITTKSQSDDSNKALEEIKKYFYKNFPELAFYIYEIFGNLDNPSVFYKKAKEASYDSVVEQAYNAKNKFKDWHDVLDSKPPADRTEYENVLDYNLRMVHLALVRQDTFLSRLQAYLERMQVVKNPSDLDINGKVELIIDCAEYLMVDYFKFVNTFEWSDNYNSYIVKEFKNEE